MTSYIERYKQTLIDEHVINPEKVRGISQEEIRLLMNAQNVRRLPKIFLDFLMIVGDGVFASFFVGSDWGLEVWPSLKDSMQLVIQHYGQGMNFPEDAFVFFEHQGYEFLYFLTDNEDDNPPVFRYMEGDEKSVKHFDSLTEYFDTILETLKEMRDIAERRQKKK